MSFQPSWRWRPRALGLLALSATVAGAQYSTPVGTGAAKPKTLRATAVLEWTGSLEKPSASRLMPIAVWDGEHYQPAGLYLARPDPLALETGTQYELERSGEPVGLFNVRAAAELNGEWIGVGRFQAEASPPPPPKLKASKHLPVLSNGKPATPEKGTSPESSSGTDGRPTLHRKTDDSASTPDASAQAGTPAGTQTPSDKTASSSSKPADASSTSSSDDSDHPVLHRRPDTSDTSSTNTGTPSQTTGASPASGSGNTSGTSSTTSSSTTSDSDGPTLHRRSDTAGTKSPDVDPDRPTLHKHDDSASDVDPDRPTLHRARSGADTSAAIDPDRPRLRYGGSADTPQSALPTRLVGVPPTMQQIVAVSDSAIGEPRPYQYHWASPDDATHMQTALAALAAQAVAKPNPTTAKPAARFGPASHTVTSASKTHQAKSTVPATGPALVDEHFTAYELSFSGGATLVYSAHTEDEGPKRIFVTLIAQPDFSGKPQILLQQVTRGDRLDEVPAMQLVDAIDTDNDQRAELIFQLTGAVQAPAAAAESSQAAKDLAANTATDQATQFARDAAASAAASAAAVNKNAALIPERSFAIYQVANGKALQVFNTGPLP